MNAPKTVIKGNKEITTRPNGTKRVRTIPEGETLTQQQFQEECDVNNIIAKYKKTGTVTHVRNAQSGVYADLTNLPDLQEAQAVVIAAEQAFQEIPASLRQRFGHDPQKLIDWLRDEKNTNEAIELGLVVPPEMAKPDLVLEELKTLNKNLTPKKSPSKKED